jgi:5-carboxymethyl-2-hydroxymuconate isomerase
MRKYKMPHVSIEFSDGLEQNYDIQLLCKNVFAALADQPDFPNPAAIKIRAQPVSFFCLGSGIQTFVHATFSLLSGRDEPTRKRLNLVILNALENALPDVASLTVQDVQMSNVTYAKRVL